MLKKISLILIMTSMICGCASTPIHKVVYNVIDVSFPPLNTTQKKTIGEELVKQGKLTVGKAIKIKRMIEKPGVVLPGIYLLDSKKTDGTEIYYPFENNAGFLPNSLWHYITVLENFKKWGTVVYLQMIMK